MSLEIAASDSSDVEKYLLLGLWYSVKEAGDIEIPFNRLRRPAT